MGFYDEDFKKKIIIDLEQTQYDKIGGWTLIEVIEEPGGMLTDHGYFYIWDDIFDRIQYTRHEKNTMLKVISNVCSEPIREIFQYEAPD